MFSTPFICCCFSLFVCRYVVPHCVAVRCLLEVSTFLQFQFCIRFPFQSFLSIGSFLELLSLLQCLAFSLFNHTIVSLPSKLSLTSVSFLFNSSSVTALLYFLFCLVLFDLLHQEWVQCLTVQRVYPLVLCDPVWSSQFFSSFTLPFLCSSLIYSTSSWASYAVTLSDCLCVLFSPWTLHFIPCLGC